MTDSGNHVEYQGLNLGISHGTHMSYPLDKNISSSAVFKNKQKITTGGKKPEMAVLSMLSKITDKYYLIYSQGHHIETLLGHVSGAKTPLLPCL